MSRVAGVLQGLRVAVAAFLLALLALAAAPVLLGWHAAAVLSGSMAPAVQVGDVVVSRPADRLEVGQVLVVDDPVRPGRLLTHRLVGETPDGRLRLQGDANAAEDSTPVAVEAVRGRMALRVPLVGLPVVWLRTGQVGHLALAAGALGLLAGSALLPDAAPRGRHARPRSARA